MRSASQRFAPVRAVEWEPAAAATFALNHGGRIADDELTSDAVFAGDIAKWLEHDDVPEVDVVVGGPPCQGFSNLGKRDVLDERNLLWREYATTVSKARPQYFVLENVPAFLTSPQYGVFLEELSAGGMLADYTFDAQILNAADYGAAQSRKRVVVIGHHKDLPAPGFPKATTSQDDWLTLGQALARVPAGVTAVGLPDAGAIRFGDRRFPGPFSTRQLHVGRKYQDISLRRFPEIPYGGSRFDLPDELKAPCWRKHTSGSGDVMGRLRWEDPSVTIRTEFHKPEKGRYLHPVEHRVITHYEAALIQGFPEDYRWAGSFTQIARQIGNAVPIPLGQAVGRLLLDALDAHAPASVEDAA